MNKYERQEQEPVQQTIQHLHGVYRCANARFRGERNLYVGLSVNNVPVVTDSLDTLSQDAQRNVEDNITADLTIPVIPYTRLIPVQFLRVDQPTDYRDEDDRKIEDVLHYSVKDSTGNTRKVSIGELSFLEAILMSQKPWQVPGTGRSLEDMRRYGTVDEVLTALPMYTLLAHSNGLPVEVGYAMVFPSIENESNEYTFARCIKQTLEKLVRIDSVQPEGGKKGYEEVMMQYAKKMEPKEKVNPFFKPFVSGTEEDMRQFQRDFKAGGIKFLRNLGLASATDEELEDLKNPPSEFDLDALDLETLFALVKDIHTTVSASLKRPNRS